VQDDGVKSSEAGADASAGQSAPEVDLQPGGGGASEQQLAAGGEGADVQDDGVKAEEAAAANGATASQLDAAGEDNVQADGVKESEVQAAAAPAAAEAKPQAAGAISASVVKELREKSGAGMMACKKALSEAAGDFDKALEALRVKGLAQAGKKAGRVASEGLIAQYIHAGARLGVLVEVNCETDFVGRGDQFKELVSNIAMQIAASPEASYVSIEEVPKEFVDSETAIEMGKEDILAKPENIRGKIVEGRVQKTIARGALLEQPFIRDTAKTVGEVVSESTASLGEKISIRRFERFVLGEGIVKKEADLAAEVEQQTKEFEQKAAEKAAAAADAPAAEVAAEVADAAKPAVQVSAKMVKELRDKSGAGMMDCKKALAETAGDVKAAEEFLRKKGLSSAGKKAGRTAADGAIGAYVHLGSQLGVLVEVNCETDFVARGDKFKELVSDLAMQIAASPSVTVVAIEDVDQEMLERERQIELQKEDLQSKPENIREKIVEGRIAKVAKEAALMEQPFIKDSSRTVGEVIKSTIAAIGENIQVRQFARYVLGEGLEKKSNDFAAEVAQQTGRA
jgi:elongation factor Ts